MKTLSIVAALVVGASSLAVAQNSTAPTTPSAPAAGGSASPGSGPAGGGAGTVSGKSGAEPTNNRGPGKNASVHKSAKHKKKSPAQ
jgi:hypothetical protein